MKLGFAAKTGASLRGHIKLARMLEMSEADFEKRVKKLEGAAMFKRLSEAGVLSIQPYSQARLAARRFAGREMKGSGGGLPEILDGKGELAQLMTRVGQENFEECFLRNDDLADGERASRCGISTADARRLREFVDRLYIQAEFEGPAQAAPAKIYSAVAGIDVDQGKPVLGFFHREIWKGRYHIDQAKRAQISASMPEAEAERAEQFLRQLEHLNRRKSTLLKALEALLEAQKDYLVSRDPARRRPFTQRALADRIEATPSVLNRLISNKSVQLPWGLETPLKELVPSAKTLMRDRLYQIAHDNPRLSDRGLCGEIRRRHGVMLSRRSVAQYRKELGLGCLGRRGDGPKPRNKNHQGTKAVFPEN